MQGSCSFLSLASSIVLLSLLVATTASASDSNDAQGCRRPLGVGEPIRCAAQEKEPDASGLVQTLDQFRDRMHDVNRQRHADLQAIQPPDQSAPSSPKAEIAFNPRGNFYVIGGLAFEANDPEAVRAIASFTSLPLSDLPPGLEHVSLMDVLRRAKYYDMNPGTAEERDQARSSRPPTDIALYRVDGAVFTSDEVAQRLTVDRRVAIARLITLATAGQAVTWEALRAAHPALL